MSPKKRPAADEPPADAPAVLGPGETVLAGPDAKQAAPDAEPEPEPKMPARSDLQEANEPCSICYPDGWPEQVFSLGCEHGTWLRKRPD